MAQLTQSILVWDKVNKDLFTYYEYYQSLLGIEKAYYKLHNMTSRQLVQYDLEETFLLQEVADKCRDRLRTTRLESTIQAQICLLCGLDPPPQTREAVPPALVHYYQSRDTVMLFHGFLNFPYLS